MTVSCETPFLLIFVLKSNICAQIPGANLVPENGSHLGSVFAGLAVNLRLPSGRGCVAMVEPLRGANATWDGCVEAQPRRNFSLFVSRRCQGACFRKQDEVPRRLRAESTARET